MHRHDLEYIGYTVYIGRSEGKTNPHGSLSSLVFNGFIKSVYFARILLRHKHTCRISLALCQTFAIGGGSIINNIFNQALFRKVTFLAYQPSVYDSQCGISVRL